MNDQEFRTRCDASLEALSRSLAKAADEFGFETDSNAGTVTVEFDEPRAKFVVSPQAPTRQIWVSAHSKSFKLDWNAAREDFVFPESGQTLRELMAAHITQHLGEEVTL